MFKRALFALGEGPALLECAGKLRLVSPQLEVETFHFDPARSGGLIDDLLTHAVEFRADLIVVGARRHVLARRISMFAPCPVLMVPDGEKLDFSRVLVPVDFSESSAAAVRMGAELAQTTGGECLHVVVECDSDPWLDWQDHPTKLGPDLREFVTQSGGFCSNGSCLVEPLGAAVESVRTGYVEGADVASTIIATSRRVGASLIVMGTRGRSPAASVLIGSVTEKVLQLSSRPVLAVKQPGEQLGLLKALLERLRAAQPDLVVS